MRRARRAVALAAALTATVVPAVARAGGDGTLVCHGTGSAGNSFVLLAVSGNASVGGSSKESTNDFPFNPWYASCAEQYADLGNHQPGLSLISGSYGAFLVAVVAALAIVAATQLVSRFVIEMEQEPEDARSNWARSHWRRLASAGVMLLAAGFALSRIFH